MKAYFKGFVAEFIVQIFLLLKGYKILFHRYSNHCGEIDIIVSKNKCIIFVEVKFRKSASNINESITIWQQNRIRKSASIFMKKFPNYDARFDAIFISYTGIQHLKNVF